MDGLGNIVSYSNYYAFGGLEPSRYYSSNSYRFGYNGQEKDDNILGDGTMNHALYWEYDTRIGRRWNLDPKDQFNVSNYAAFGLNPIVNNDINGDTWQTPADEKKAAEINQKLENRKADLQNLAAKYATEADKAEAKGRFAKAVSLRAQAADAKAGVIELAKAQSELGDIANNPLEFTFRQSDNAVNETYLDDKGTVVIQYGTDANAVHELTHAHQEITGEMQLVMGHKARYLDATDEQNAYRRQYFYSPSSVTNIKNKTSINVTTSQDITVPYVLGMYTLDKFGFPEYTYKHLSSFISPLYVPNSPAEKASKK